MTDVFISYKRENLAAVGRLVEALRAEGVGVWWDQDIPPNAAWEATIEAALAAAKLVIVAWSPASVASENVKAEARRARTQGRLLQVFVEVCEPPLFFGERQGVDLQHWSGATSDPAFRTVLDAIRDRVTVPLIPTAATHAPSADDARATDVPAAPLSKPSIAVLPFTDMTGARGEDYFADGMVEEIATALSRFPSLFVNASGSNAAYREAARNLKAIGRELGVRYLLEGSVRKSGTAVRISVKLVDATDGAQLWAERFDGTLDDVFALQDTVANAAASQIEPSIEAAEIRRAQARPTEDPGAYELWLQGLRLLRTYGREPLQEACALFDEAIARDPGYALALGSASFCHSLLLPMGFSDDPEADRKVALDFAQRALRNAGDDPQVLAWVSAATAHCGGDIVAADAMIDRALKRNPGSSFTWYFSGWLNMYSGRHPTAIEHFKTSLRLDPRTPDRANILNGMAWALIGLHRFEEAISQHREAAQLLAGHDGIRIGLCVSYAHLGRIAEAKSTLRTVPAATFETMIGAFRDPDLIALARSGVALARADATP